jgi:hypothetical protein
VFSSQPRQSISATRISVWATVGGNPHYLAWVADETDPANPTGEILRGVTLTSVPTTSDISAKEKPEEEGPAAKPLKDSKFNDLSVSLAFTITGLIVVYLPDFLNNSFDWKIEGRLIGIGLAIIGSGFTLIAAEKLTGRSGFGIWGFCLVVLVTAISAIVWALRAHHLPKWSAVVLTILMVNLTFVAVYALVSGFTSFFDEADAKALPTGKASGADDASEGSSDVEEKEIGWYERITLIIAVISTIATLVAAIEPIVHP